ncbi:MAG: 30S ribosomal protein S14 [Holosporales bacterium]|jgi:small subunit ribosomal protein S14|nr:30S ribosomal protein S14 [Holosporales bacterium]
MAKKSSMERCLHIRSLVRRAKNKRGALKSVIYNRKEEPAVRFAAQMKLAALPRNGSATRIRNRCEITGRARGYYRKFRISRIMIREMAAQGIIPGMRKASW